MIKHMRQGFIIVLCFVLILNTVGCWNRRELNTLAIVMGLGIDKAQEPGEMQLTAQIVKPGELKSKGDTSPSGKAYWNIQNSGDTLFNTLRGFTHEANRKLYFPHIQVLIFGRDLAAEGVQEQIDFFARDQETRLDIWVLVSEDKASEVLDIPSELEKIPAMNISKLVEAQPATSQTCMVKLDQFISHLMNKTTSSFAPLIKVSGEGQEKSVLIEGTAVFKRDKLIGELNKTETRGLLWIIDEVKSGIIDVDRSEEDSKVSLEILRSKTKITPEIIDNKIYITIAIKEEGTIGSQYYPEDLTTPEKIKTLEEKQSAVIQEEVEMAITKVKELNSDIFGFGDAVHQRYRDEWKELEANWDEIFPDIEVEVTVESKLRRSGRITSPPIPEKE